MTTIPPATELRHLDRPLVGWKVARLGIDLDRRPLFLGSLIGRTYGPRDVATCNRDPRHVPPLAGCRCGFYAWRHRSQATRSLRLHEPVRCRVELAGRFESFDRGYVAAAQLVTSVEVLERCVACAKAEVLIRAVVLGTDRRHDLAEVPPGARALHPLCADHARRSRTTVGLHELGEQLGVGVNWLVEDEATGFHLDLERGWHRDEPAIRSVGELALDETVLVDHLRIRRDTDGTFHVDRAARPVLTTAQRSPAVRLTRDGFELLLEGVDVPAGGWRRTPQPADEPVRVIGTPIPTNDEETIRVA